MEFRYFSNESQIANVFNERTYTLLGVIRDEEPESIRETARLVGRDKWKRICQGILVVLLPVISTLFLLYIRQM